jgi:cell division protein FtsB
MRLAVRGTLSLVALVGAGYLFVAPLRTYLFQRHEIAAEEHTVAVLATETNKLRTLYRDLQSNATVEQLARQYYGFVIPGQQAFMVLPPASHPKATPAPNRKPAPWYAFLEFWHHF